jgi:hypothetical protein
MSVSICIPTWNRKRFEKLIEYNINCQTYSKIKEVIIADDGDDEPLVLDIFYPIRYIKLPKRITIGAKRNLLACQAEGDYICHMDTDDIYSPNYIMYGMNCLKDKYELFGSSCMLITFPNHNWKVCASVCYDLHRTNEATMIYKKTFWREARFSNSSVAEGQPFLKGREDKIFSGDISNIMVCIAHGENTVCKKRWIDNGIPESVYPVFNAHKKIYLDNIDVK